jgi:penicillin-binding protein activator
MGLFKYSILLSVLSIFIGCTQVDRMDEKDVVDFSGNWNNTDSRLVAEEMIKDSLNKPWITDYIINKKNKPVVVVGTVRNNTAEHINVETFTKEIERAFVNSGKIKVVANVFERAELRDELERISQHARADTIKKIKQETGADFVLMGVINDIVDKKGSKRVQYYQVNLELIDLENHEKSWIGQKKISKVVNQRKLGF